MFMMSWYSDNSACTISLLLSHKNIAINYSNTCTMHLLNFKLYYQQLHLKYLCNLVRYWSQAPWGRQDSVKTCRSVIICKLIVLVHLLVIVQNNCHRCMNWWTVSQKLEISQALQCSVRVCKREWGSKYCGVCSQTFHFVWLERSWLYKKGESDLEWENIKKGLNMIK